MGLISVFALMVFPAIVIIAALRDTTTMTIPNWLCATGLATFAPAAGIAHLNLGEIGLCIGVGLACLGVGIGMFAAGWIGGGDAKLMAVCGLWLGWGPLGPFLISTALGGGVFTLLLVWGRAVAAPIANMGPSWLSRLLKPGGDVPYGVAIAIGALIAFPESALFMKVHPLLPIQLF